MLQKLNGLLLAMLATSSPHLSAQSYTPKPYTSRDVAGWTIAPTEHENGACAMVIDYEGRPSTRLALAIDNSGVPGLMLLNDSWTVRADEIYRLNYQLSFGSYSDHATIGLKDGSLFTKFDKYFPDLFAKSTYLHIYKGDTVVERLSLKGSSAAVAEVRRCVAHIQREAEAINRDRRKFEDIPSNPFADQSGAAKDRH